MGAEHGCFMELLLEGKLLLGGRRVVACRGLQLELMVPLKGGVAALWLKGGVAALWLKGGVAALWLKGGVAALWLKGGVAALWLKGGVAALWLKGEWLLFG